MSQNDAESSSHPDKPPNIEELRKRIAHAREQAVSHIGKGETSHWEDLSLETVATMLARVEDLLDRQLAREGPAQPTGAPPMPSTSASAASAGTGAVPAPTSTTAQAPPALPASTPPDNSALAGITTQVGVAPVMSLNLYSEPTCPANPLTFSYLWKLWAVQARKTQKDIPKLDGKFVDLHLMALHINSLGGQAEIDRNPAIWRRLAFKLKLIGAEDQADEYSKRVVNMLQTTQRDIIGPFEQYCIEWTRLSESERNQRLAEYAATAKSIKSKIPSHVPFGEDVLPTVTTEPNGKSSADKADPVVLAGIGSKLLEAYFQNFYPGVPVKTKIERLLKMTLSQARNHTWTKSKEDWLTKFQQYHEGRDATQVAAHMAKELLMMAQKRVLASIKSTEIPGSSAAIPSEGKSEASSQRGTLFSGDLVRRANTFIEETIQKIEDVRAIQKRIDVPESHRKRLKGVVTGGYDAALSFYHTAALHYMLYQNEKTTRTFMMQAVMVLEQFFFSSTGYPTHIITLDYAESVVNGLQKEGHAMMREYIERRKAHSRTMASTKPPEIDIKKT